MTAPDASTSPLDHDAGGAGDICCPNCGQDLALTINAALPAVTDLTVTLKVEPGQLMRLDTMAGVMSSWRELQIAVANSMGGDAEVFLADMGQRDNEFWFTGRITNVVRGEPQNPAPEVSHVG